MFVLSLKKGNHKVVLTFDTPISDQHIAFLLQRFLYGAFEDLGEIYAKNYNVSPDVLKIPIRVSFK